MKKLIGLLILISLLSMVFLIVKDFKAIELNKGYYIEPTIIEGLSYDCSINQEEIFGRVVSIMPFKDEEQVIKMANSTKYGLSASIFTENLSKAHRVASKIYSGIIWVNTWRLRDLRIPFGGMKSTGVGLREMGREAIAFFTELKVVYWDYTGSDRKGNLY